MRGERVRVASSEESSVKEDTRRRLREMGYDPGLLDAAAGSRWDPTFQRWVKDERTQYEDIIITPKTGSPYIIWPAIFQVLKQNGLESLPTEKVEDLLAGGKATVIDVRMTDQFEAGHIKGSVNVPMYRDSTGNGFWDNAKRIVNAALLIRSTERDPDFPDKVAEVIKDKSKPVILYCGMGGSMETKIQSQKEMYAKNGFEDVDKSFGRESRSLKACFELLNAGFTNVKHLKGGFSTWKYEKRPVESGDDDKEREDVLQEGREKPLGTE
eukprot:CAMPEP_0184482076 /NCGR_PEP_ID=MMETSP0113_2-20130426/3650_1 /TAXON_ID=91329 /ORGANISM="Norrisiella sphaerica, Strain BC52" /LENGTH=268 /DNA_ID=CAMNT_0026861605 /DNA_START=228 /DNA_END=1032 /DNA_ORIENTATION=+